MYRFMMLGILCLWSSTPSHASTIALALAHWNYSESSPRIQGFNATPMQSQAAGNAIQLHLEHQWQDPELGYLRASIQGLRNLSPVQEHWQLNTQQQSNQLRIQEAALQSEIGITQQHLDVGLLASYQWHQQSRQHFIIGGSPIPIQGEPVLETVQNLWLGLTIRHHTSRWAAEASWEIPIWVHTRNTLVHGTFTTTSGFRVHTAISYHPKQSSWQLHLAYNMREQGGEMLNQQWLWPKNRWQMLALRLSYAW